MGSVIILEQVRLARTASTLQQVSVRQDQVASDLRGAARDFEKLGVCVAAIHSDLVVADQRLSKCLSDLKASQHRRHQIMRAIETIEALMRRGAANVDREGIERTVRAARAPIAD